DGEGCGDRQQNAEEADRQTVGPGHLLVLAQDEQFPTVGGEHCEDPQGECAHDPDVLFGDGTHRTEQEGGQCGGVGTGGESDEQGTAGDTSVEEQCQRDVGVCSGACPYQFDEDCSQGRDGRGGEHGRGTGEQRHGDTGQRDGPDTVTEQGQACP